MAAAVTFIFIFYEIREISTGSRNFRDPCKFRILVDIFCFKGQTIGGIAAGHLGATPLKFNSSPLKSYLPNRKVVFQTQFFRGANVKLQGCSFLPFFLGAIFTEIFGNKT